MPTSTAPATATITVPCTACARWNRIDPARAAAGPRCGACKAAILLDRPLHLDDATFDRVIAGTTIPVLVDFYADWCGPCRMMAPAVDALARETAGTTLVAKVDTEVAQQVAQRFRITGLPTVALFRDGREVRRQAGAIPLGALRAMAGGASQE